MRNYLQPTYIAQIRVGTEDSPENEWRRLLKIAFTLFEVPPDGMTFLTSCEFLHRVLSLSNKMTDILPFLEKKFDFFEKILDSSQLKVILKWCCNCIHTTIAPICRARTTRPNPHLSSQQICSYKP